MLGLENAAGQRSSWREFTLRLCCNSQASGVKNDGMTEERAAKSHERTRRKRNNETDRYARKVDKGSESEKIRPTIIVWTLYSPPSLHPPRCAVSRTRSIDFEHSFERLWRSSGSDDDGGSGGGSGGDVAAGVRSGSRCCGLSYYSRSPSRERSSTASFSTAARARSHSPSDCTPAGSVATHAFAVRRHSSRRRRVICSIF